MITVTEAARAKVLELIKTEQPGRAVRVGIKGRGPGGFIYDLRFIGEDEAGPEDTLIEAGGFKLVVDAPSVPGLQESTLDYIENLSLARDLRIIAETVPVTLRGSGAY